MQILLDINEFFLTIMSIGNVVDTRAPTSVSRWQRQQFSYRYGCLGSPDRSPSPPPWRCLAGDSVVYWRETNNRPLITVSVSACSTSNFRIWPVSADSSPNPREAAYNREYCRIWGKPAEQSDEDCSWHKIYQPSLGERTHRVLSPLFLLLVKHRS